MKKKHFIKTLAAVIIITITLLNGTKITVTLPDGFGSGDPGISTLSDEGHPKEDLYDDVKE